MDAVALLAIAVIVVNLAFVVVPARELRDLLAPPRRPAPVARKDHAGPADTPMPAPAPSSGARPSGRPVAPGSRSGRHAIVLRSAGAGVAPAGIAGD
ncbi:MAG TPA: hypothetical protein VNP95_00495 [Thermomicrobiales bacterium]|nr:hypothetical protein [Thermomicrobiales bacterium]